MKLKFLDNKVNLYLFAFAAVLVESFTSVFQKLAGQHPFMSVPFILLYCCAVGVMGIYAVMWQFILEKLPLSMAYLRKGASYILLYVWAMLFFNETLSVTQIIGSGVIIIGMVVSMSEH